MDSFFKTNVKKKKKLALNELIFATSQKKLPLCDDITLSILHHTRDTHTHREHKRKCIGKPMHFYFFVLFRSILHLFFFFSPFSRKTSETLAVSSLLLIASKRPRITKVLELLLHCNGFTLLVNCTSKSPPG